MKKAVRDHGCYVAKLKVCASEYSDRIVLLRKDIAKLSQTYRNQQDSVSSQSLSPHRALDRVPKMDRLKETYRRLQILADNLEEKALPDKIFEYENFPARYILEGTSSINHDVNVNHCSVDVKIDGNRGVLGGLEDGGIERKMDQGRKGGVIDLNRLMESSTRALEKAVHARNKNFAIGQEFKSMEETLRLMTNRRRERTEALKQVHNKLLVYISKVPYS